MRGLFVDAHVRLLRAVRGAIAADAWFDAWLATGAEGSDEEFPSNWLVLGW